MKAGTYRSIMNYISETYDMISGKIFFKGTSKEAKDLKKELMMGKLMLRPTEIDEVYKGIAILNEVGFWPELDIIEEARKTEPKPMAFPLDYKQLVILNRLFFHPNDEAIFITTGIGGSGKSTYLNIIRQLFDNDVANCSLSDLSNGFNLAEAVKHRLIASDELAKGELSLPIVKQLSSKQKINVNPKNQTPYDVQSQSALFFCCNRAPKIDVTDTGILRRIVYYERNTRISNPDPTMNKREYTHDELVNFLANAYALEKELGATNWFSIFENETHKYLMKDNSVYICMDAHDYNAYKSMCYDKGLKAYAEPNWEEIKELFEEWKYREEFF